MGRITILMYHIVGDALSRRERRFCCRAGRFAAQMDYVAAQAPPFLSLDTLADALDGRTPWPSDGGVVVTFDDGFADTFETAMPSLLAHAIPATMFVVSGRIDGRNDWMTNRGFPERRLMSLGQIEEMQAGGITIGSHTRTHPRLPELAPDAQREEILNSKAELESALGRRVDHFAYPYGLLTELSVEIAGRAGYRTACSTRSGFNREDSDRLLLRRIDVYGTDSMLLFRQKLKFGSSDASLLRPLRYYGRRVAERARSVSRRWISA